MGFFHISIIIVIALLFTAAAIWGMRSRNYGLVDLFWGGGFAAVAITALMVADEHLVSSWLVAGAVVVWGGRLTAYLAKRNIGASEDRRYAAMRSRWEPHADLHAAVKVFGFQALLVLLLSWPVMESVRAPADLSIWHVVGLALFIGGFVVETVADAQKNAFKSDPANRDRFLRSGLWACSRHPNYFGEAVLWWGIWCMTVPAAGVFPGILTPLVITVLVRYVSGVPLLEKRYEGRAGFADYKRATPIFIPWCRRSAR